MLNQAYAMRDRSIRINRCFTPGETRAGPTEKDTASMASEESWLSRDSVFQIHRGALTVATG